MGKGTRDPHGSATGEHGLTVGAWSEHRRPYLDNLKVLLVAAIIAGHGVAGYADVEFWSYAEIRETTLADATTIGLLALVGPFALFMIPLLFLVAGLPLMYPIHPPGETPESYWKDFLTSGGWGIDASVMWFVGVLLIFSLGYAAWVRWRGARLGRLGRSDVSLGRLLLLALVVTVTTFLVRLVYEYDGDEYVIDLNVYQWPQCLAMFGLGVVASRQGWLRVVPDRLRRQCRTATLVAGAAFGAFMAAGAGVGAFEEGAWRGGQNVDAFAFTALESMVTVVGPVWLLGVAQRYLEALIVAGGGVAGSFALAWLLIKRVPAVGRVL